MLNLNLKHMIGNFFKFQILILFIFFIKEMIIFCRVLFLFKLLIF